MAQRRITLDPAAWTAIIALDSMSNSVIQSKHAGSIRMRIDTSLPSATETTGFTLPAHDYVNGEDFKFSGNPGWTPYMRGPGSIEIWDA